MAWNAGISSNNSTTDSMEEWAVFHLGLRLLIERRMEEESQTLLFRGARFADEGTEEKDDPGDYKGCQESV